MARSNRGTYYIGRVIKLGQLNDDALSGAILKPSIVHIGKHAWTFINAARYNFESEEFLFGRLSKYSPDAEVKVIDESRRQEMTRVEPNLSIASSPFIYLPRHSGIAFLHVANHVDRHIFVRRFCDVVKGSLQNFFVDCAIDLVSDLQTFASKLKRLNGIVEISVNISPPNPVFAPLWQPLKNYLDDRNLGKLDVAEQAPVGEFLNTNLPTHVSAVAEQTDATPYKPIEPLPLTDAAILMAADGYGEGVVRGNQDGVLVVIKTSETAKNFAFDRNPRPEELFAVVSKLFKEIERDRKMEH
jgi:hypothetical protein